MTCKKPLSCNLYIQTFSYRTANINTPGDGRHSKPYPSFHCRVLPPGEFNGKIPEPLPVYTFQFQVQFVLLLWLLSFACLHLKFVSVCSLHCTPSITWPVYDRLGVFSILKLSRNSEEEEVSWRHPFCGRFYRKDARKQTWLQTQLWSSNKHRYKRRWQ